MSVRDLPTPRMVEDSGADHWSHKIDSGGFSELVAAEWHRLYGRDERKPHAVPGTIMRGSNAGHCLRQLYYYGRGVEPSDPMTVADEYRANVGTVLHEFIQTPRIWGDDAQYEVPWHLPDLSLSGAIDVWLPNTKTAVEAKSQGGWKFKKTGVFNNAEGPAEENLRQLGLAMHALGATHGILLTIGLEVVNATDTVKYGITDECRWLGEWVYSYHDLEDLIADELARQRIALDAIEANEPPTRHIVGMPERAAINQPFPNRGNATWTVVEDDGTVSDTGTHWACTYCHYRTKCAEDRAIGV